LHLVLNDVLVGVIGTHLDRGRVVDGLLIKRHLVCAQIERCHRRARRITRVGNLRKVHNNGLCGTRRSCRPLHDRQSVLGLYLDEQVVARRRGRLGSFHLEGPFHRFARRRGLGDAEVGQGRPSVSRVGRQLLQEMFNHWRELEYRRHSWRIGSERRGGCCKTGCQLNAACCDLALDCDLVTLTCRRRSDG
jgi:hypothetical protein